MNPAHEDRLHARPCSLVAHVRVERAARDDWLALAPLHYRSHQAGAITDVFRLVYDARGAREGGGAQAAPSRPVRAAHPVVNGGAREGGGAQAAPSRPVLVGVIVYSRSSLSLGARDRATGGRYRTAGLGRIATAALVNRELRIISRLVIAPNWRGLGLASRLVAATMPQVAAPYVEALAAMGSVHPFFERAGMTAYPQPPSKEAERLTAALEAAGVGRRDRRSAEALARALDALPEEARRLAEREIERWARSYLAAKNHRTNRPDRRRRLDLVARHLDARPVYYLWRRPDLPVGARNDARHGAPRAEGTPSTHDKEERPCT